MMIAQKPGDLVTVWVWWKSADDDDGFDRRSWQPADGYELYQVSSNVN